MLVGEQVQLARFAHHRVEEAPCHLTLEQAFAQAREVRLIESALLQTHVQEPAEQNVVIELFHQQALTPNRVEQLQQLGAQEALGRNRRAAMPRVERVEFTRHLPQDLVDEGANRPQRVIRRHTLFGGHIAEHGTRLTIVSSHACHGSTRSPICRSPTMRFSATS